VLELGRVGWTTRTPRAGRTSTSSPCATTAAATGHPRPGPGPQTSTSASSTQTENYSASSPSAPLGTTNHKADRERCRETPVKDVPRHHKVPPAGFEPATHGLGIARANRAWPLKCGFAGTAIGGTGSTGSRRQQFAPRMAPRDDARSRVLRRSGRAASRAQDEGVGVDERQAGRPVSVGVDGSESSMRAVRWAAREAGRRHAPLRIVQAIGWAPQPIQSSDTRTVRDPRHRCRTDDRLHDPVRRVGRRGGQGRPSPD
jgi:hypothetical protein